MASDSITVQGKTTITLDAPVLRVVVDGDQNGRPILDITMHLSEIADELSLLDKLSQLRVKDKG